MAEETTFSGAPDKRLAAVCGLYCGACPVFIATHHDPVRRPELAERFGLPLGELSCAGCRSGSSPQWCIRCDISGCASGRDLEFCVECGEYPCELLWRFKKDRPHCIEIWEDLEWIRAEGWERWLARVKGRYVCPSCGRVNSAYDLSCWSCGKDPSCGYVMRHRRAVEGFLRKHPERSGFRRPPRP